MVNSASRSKAPMQKLADRISKIFVPAVIAVSIITFIPWAIFGGENRWMLALANAVAVLIVACPCALGLATPMSMTVGIGKGAKNGILIKNAEALEEMAKINTLITDKTGTLTVGKPSVNKIVSENGSENEILELAAALNQNSEHPLANAVLEKFKKENSDQKSLEKTENFENISGKGIRAEIGGNVVLLGNEALLNQFKIKIPENLKQKATESENQANTLFYLAKNEEVLGFITYTDEIKASSKKSHRISPARRCGRHDDHRRQCKYCKSRRSAAWHQKFYWRSDARR